MKNIKHINEFLNEIYEERNLSLFIDEPLLKDLLMEDKEFAKGDVHQGIVDIIHNKWQSDDKSYGQILEWTEETFGFLPLFCMCLGKYNNQVCNGGHMQYYGNGYASYNSRGWGYGLYKDISMHDDFVKLFKDLDMINILPLGQKAYSIISNFELELEEEEEECDNCRGRGEVECEQCNGAAMVDCEECGGLGENEEGKNCEHCDGNGTVECDECKGYGKIECEDCNGDGVVKTGNEVPYTSEWENLDKKWYEINDQVMEQFNDYLKSLTLDGEKMVDLIELADKTQKYNL